MKKKLKKILLIIFSVISAFAILVAMFLNFSPQFGASKKAIRTDKVLSSSNYSDGIFNNLEETKVMPDFKWSTMKKFFTENEKVDPASVPVDKIEANTISELNDTLTRITWFGHSAIMVETAGKVILIDPMLGNAPSPVPWFGSGRFNPELPIDISSLPFIDVVLISHDHYDHLDYGSILDLKEKTGKFFVPLGVGAHLRSWDVDEDRIVEMDWWESEILDDVTFVSTPARHFSGRGLFDRFSTLWCSWIIKTDHTNIYFSGDGGYGKHFKEIGDKYGPFDFTMMECGQYHKDWALIHLLPWEIPQAQLDLKGKLMMPIHWGAFRLALHGWREPVELLLEETEKIGMEVTTPRIGESFVLGQDFPDSKWYTDDYITHYVRLPNNSCTAP